MRKQQSKRLSKFLFLFFLLLGSAGCVEIGVLSSPSSSPLAMDEASWSHQNVLAKGPLELEGGKLLDRATFLTTLPMRLMRIANAAEAERQAIVSDLEPGLGLKRPWKESTAEWKRLLRSPYAEERSMGLSWMGLSADSSSPPATAEEAKAISALEDPNEYVRISAIRTLSRQQNREILPLLQRSLADPSEFVRLETVRGLAQFDRDVVQSLLLIALQDASPWVRGEATVVLGKQQNPEVVSYLWPLLADPEGYVRDQAAIVLRQLTGKDLGYRSYEPNSTERQKIVEQWKTWWESTGQKTKKRE